MYIHHVYSAWQGVGADGAKALLAVAAPHGAGNPRFAASAPPAVIVRRLMALAQRSLAKLEVRSAPALK